MTPTLEEMQILKMSADLWNALVGLEGTESFHCQDLNEHMRDIHNIQNRIMARTYSRTQKQKENEQGK